MSGSCYTTYDGGGTSRRECFAKMLASRDRAFNSRAAYDLLVLIPLAAKVVRWWAKRADLILLLFDPDSGSNDAGPEPERFMEVDNEAARRFFPAALPWQSRKSEGVGFPLAGAGYDVLAFFVLVPLALVMLDAFSRVRC